METKEINIAALLKDCPKGTKLYSPLCGVCYYDGESDVAKLPNIRVKAFDGSRFVLNVYGRGVTYPDGECLLFPSKENRDWLTFKAPQTEQPKFKVGDVVKVAGFADVVYAVVVRAEGNRINWKAGNKSATNFLACDATLATSEEIDTWNKCILHPDHLHYSKSKHKIIHWFLPFDKIVARADEEIWCGDFFTFYTTEYETEKDTPFRGIGGVMYDECLPYNEKTAHLIGTTDDYEED